MHKFNINCRTVVAAFWSPWLSTEALKKVKNSPQFYTLQLSSWPVFQLYSLQAAECASVVALPNKSTPIQFHFVHRHTQTTTRMKHGMKTYKCVYLHSFIIHFCFLCRYWWWSRMRGGVYKNTDTQLIFKLFISFISFRPHLTVWVQFHLQQVCVCCCLHSEWVSWLNDEEWRRRRSRKRRRRSASKPLRTVNE